jgi:hypothetical protein
MRRKIENEQGSALIYILIAIALLALLTFTFMQPSSQQTQSQNSFKLDSDLGSQIDFIRSSVQECVASYFKGDITINVTPANSDPGANIKYPINPGSVHFSSATIPPTAGTRYVKDLRCPGNPGDNNNHAPIFSASTGKFLPPPPPLFEPWQWYNGTDGVFFFTSTTKTDAYITTAMEKLKANFSACEIDIVDNAASGSDLDLDSDTETVCPAHSKCFLVWMISNPSHVCH